MKYKSKEANYSLFKKVSLTALISVYFLILVGGVVRSTGSGMGCPDWPRCFGNWVPPTKAEQLPQDYKESYVEKRIAKNKKLAKYLSMIGFDKLAVEIENDRSALEETEFNKVKTWTEYINRLVGVSVGIFIFITLVASIKYIKKQPGIFYISLATFVLVAFQGWIGSVVVSTNLLHWMITIHMLIALVIVALLTWLVYSSRRDVAEISIMTSRKAVNLAIVIGTIITLTQIILGTQVREAIDIIASSMPGLMRNQWISEIGTTFLVHRSYSILILIVHIYLVYILFKNIKGKGSPDQILAKILLGVVVVEIMSGMAMAYFAIPAFLQPIHLLAASVIFGLQFYLYLRINDKKAVSAALPV